MGAVQVYVTEATAMGRRGQLDVGGAAEKGDQLQKPVSHEKGVFPRPFQWVAEKADAMQYGYE
jgi:hypothetical protein